MDLRTVQEQNIEVIKKLLAPGANTAKASFDISAGLYGVSLEAPAKSLIPFLPSWINNIPREEIKTGNSHSYKRITSLTRTGKSTASEGTVGSTVTPVTDNPSVTFGIISSGLYTVTYEAERASAGYDNALAKATAYALLGGKRFECAHMLGGTISTLGASGVGATIAAADETGITGTDIANVAHYVNIKPLNGPAMQKAILAGIVYQPAQTAYHELAGVDATADLTDGWGATGTEANATPTATKGLKITWTPISGAMGYGVFVGTTTGAANLKLQFVVGSVSYVTLSHLATGGTACVATDYTADANGIDGVRALLCASGSGAYIQRINAKLSDASGNGIPEIDAMLSQCYAQSLGIDDGELVMGIKDVATVTKKMGAGVASSALRYVINVNAPNDQFSGGYVTKYVHPVTGKIIPITVDPYMYAGTIFWIPKTIPYPMADTDAPLKIWCSYDWANFAYAITAPARNYENRMRGGIACYLPPAFGMIYDFWAN